MAERAGTAGGRPGGGRRPPAVNALRLGLVVVGVFSVVGAYVGIDQYYAARPEADVRAVDIWYHAVQLFALEMLDDPGPYPLLLELTRFTAPLVTIYALVETARVLITAEMRRRRARWAHGHVVVCGDGLLAASLARRLVATGHRVVTVSSGRADGAGTAGPMRVFGDARDPEVLRDAGIRHAAALYACTDDSAANTAIALAAGRGGEGDGPSAVYAHVADPELCLALQARHLGTDPAAALRLDFFNVADLAARHMCATHPLRPTSGRAPGVLVIGATAFARSVIVELARQWMVLDGKGHVRLRLVVIDRLASRALDELSYRFPFLPKVCDLIGYDGDVPEVADGELAVPPDQVFICYEDEQLALKTALTTDWLWRGGTGSVVVRQDQLAAVQTAAADTRGQRLLDEVSGTLRLFGVLDEACDPELIRNDLGERLARVIHESYLVARRQRGDADPASGSMVPWTALPDWRKAENRAQAADIGRKMRMIDCVLAPRVGPGAGEHRLTVAEIEELARAEHRRWVDIRASSGWVYGQERDEARRRHPAILPWERLPEHLRVCNRDTMRHLLAILADYGFRIVHK